MEGTIMRRCGRVVNLLEWILRQYRSREKLDHQQLILAAAGKQPATGDYAGIAR